VLLQLAVAAASFVNEFVRFCAGCAHDRSVLISGAGTAFYALLALAIWRRRAEAWIAPLLLVGLGAHTMLLLELARTGRSCWMCLAAGAGSVLLAGAALAPRPRLGWTAVFFWPLGAAAAASMLPFVSEGAAADGRRFADPAVALSTDSGEIVVFMLYGCGACERFHRERTPELERRYAAPGTARLRYVPVQHRQKGDAPGVRDAHLAAYAAERQGKGNEVVGRLLERHADWSASGRVLPHLEGLVDLERLRADMQDPAVAAQIEAVQKWADGAGANRRPMLWVHAKGSPTGTLVAHDLPWERLTRSIDLELESPR
jgi:hypothetical protein